MPLLWSAADLAVSAETKRVLVIDSLGTMAPPCTTHSIAFEMELTKLMGPRVDLDDLYLDHARYPDAESEEALVEYLQKRQAKWQPDLVVPIASPAGIFVAHYRERLFPRAPIIYAGMDRRRLPADALQTNATFVGESFDGPGFIEDMLQLAPETTNIVCVIGDSPVERYWTAAFQSEFARLTNHVGFTWLNDLSFDQMLERARKLPPRSFIFLILLLRDAAGVTLNADEALRRISAEANAPVNSIFEHQLGQGIVGGRLYQAELEGVEAARIASRILNGEAASHFPPETIGPKGPQYDWRQLRRWNITEDRLPPGSTLKYRAPVTWERYRSLIIPSVLALLVQTVLIVGLALSLRRRRKVERSLRESEERMKMAAGAAKLALWEWDFTSDKVWVSGRIRAEGGGTSDSASAYSEYLLTVHPDDREGIERAVAKALDGDGNFESVHRQGADGHVRWISARGRVEFDAAHKPVKLRGVGLDITGRKLAEEKARKSEAGKRKAEAEAQRWQQELAHVSRVSMLGELAGSLAHELNQPLSAILCNAEAAQRLVEDRGKNDEEVRDALKDIAQQGQRAGEIIAGMRAMLKKESGRIGAQDLNMVVRDVLEVVSTDLMDRRVTPVLRLDPHLPPVKGDGVQLRQVLLNLVMNACDAMSDMPKDGRQLTIQSRRLAAEVEVSVTDNGPGFSEVMLRRPFEPFRTTKAKGLGLGLAICRSIIMAHEGRLVAANNEEGGATLRFTLPAQRTDGA